MDKFDWLATESAPKKYPMEIIRAFLYAPDGSSVYVPYGADIFHGWGEMRSAHVSGPDKKPLPNKLDITFFSYAEDTFYQGSFDLPYEEILKLFQEGYFIPSRKEKQSFRRIMVGVAPGGVVCVWLKGVGRITEVFYGHAKTVDLAWSNIVDDPDTTREEYILEVLEDAVGDDGVSALKENGVPLKLWDSYRKTYPWQMQVHSTRIHRPLMYVDFFNGEKYYIELESTFKSEDFKILPAPKTIYIEWPATSGQTREFELHFNEQEVFDAFKALAGENDKYIDQPLTLDVYFQEEGRQRTISVGLRRANESIIFKEVKIEAFRIL